MDITKRDSKMLKGIAILAMLMLHLFCRRDNLPYTPLLWIGDTPLIYYFGSAWRFIALSAAMPITCNPLKQSCGIAGSVFFVF